MRLWSHRSILYTLYDLLSSTDRKQMSFKWCSVEAAESHLWRTANRIAYSEYRIQYTPMWSQPDALSYFTVTVLVLCSVLLPGSSCAASQKYLKHLRCVHNPLQLCCGNLQWSYFHRCPYYCIAVLQESEPEVHCVALSCGRWAIDTSVTQLRYSRLWTHLYFWVIA